MSFQIHNDKILNNLVIKKSLKLPLSSAIKILSQDVPACVVSNSTIITSFSSGTLTCDTLLFTNFPTMYSSINPSRIVIPLQGVYDIKFSVLITAVSDLVATISLAVNGQLPGTLVSKNPIVPGTDTINDSMLIQLNSNDFIEIYLITTVPANVKVNYYSVNLIN